MEDSVQRLEALIQRGAERLTGHQRRLFQAEVALALCDGSARRAERRFGWGRATVQQGLHELRSGVRCLEQFAARGRLRREDQDPQLAQDLRDLLEPRTHADPELKSERRYTNLSAREARDLLQSQKGYAADDLPAERTLRKMLHRLGYRLKRIQKAKPLKKAKDTEAIFANVAAARQEARADPETLEISMDAKAKVSEGDYCRGGKNSDGRGRHDGPGLGS
jgi:transposase